MQKEIKKPEEQNIIIRPVEKTDIPEIWELAVQSFGEGVAFKKEHYESQLKLFPEGQRCIEYDGKIVGASGSLIVSKSDWEREHHFEEICDEGYIRNHNPQGEHLYGIEVVVHPDYRDLKLGKKLYEERKKLCKKLGLKSIIIGGRIPFYYKYEDQYTPEEYAEKVIAREIYDPVMTFQLNNGFTFLRILKNYIPEDTESRTNASLMEWKND
ncbi:GNAT family N-acetyltransferase [Alteribacillus iranensis]|uniref:Acetyltransferase (GNAT) family protein n=1 Tax=Alteribacillus iranensis TaxID=930128 RepID=A0A1I2E1Q8_9BACI|nr:GNAT family N-acetyltransferase [Alteribacillus iranensis]SFE86616.1 Acetyltransferase (GNAT) family protein [Alteribacillus iranensis]